MSKDPQKANKPADYSDDLKSAGAKFGFKTANLMNLGSVLTDFESNSSIRVEVPEFYGIEHDKVKILIDKLVPNFDTRWQEFCTDFNKSESLDDKSLSILQDIQTDIEVAFSNPANLGAIDQALEFSNLPDGKKFMIRSTGKEDSVDVANPGGNASYPSDRKSGDVASAIGGVLASYFDKKSLEQRMASGLDITETPFMPVLIQDLIGEGISSENGLITSGVIYSNNGATTLQAAPGHGELVVNSKGPVDSFHVTDSGVVYPEKSKKPFRMKPEWDEKTKKLSLSMVPNGVSNQCDFSLDEDAVRKMHQLSNHIEKSYGMRMDTEFAYDHAHKKIYIVQTRPIPEGNRLGKMPSALAPELINEVDSRASGKTITTDIKTAEIIRSTKEVFVGETIEEALNYYLHDSSGKKIKAVIIKNSAPSTSHEAGEFNSKAIPVINIPDIDNAKSMLENVANHALVIDPQRKSIYSLSPKISQISNEEILKEGLFRSTLSSEMSLFNQNFAGNPDEISNVDPSLGKSKIGDLLVSSNSVDNSISKPAMGQLFSYIHSKMNEKTPFSLQDVQDGKMHFPETITKENLGQHEEAVGKIMNTIFQYRAKDIGISNNLFKQIMISGAELSALIDKLNESKEEDLSKDPAYSGYLDVSEKFVGMLGGQEEKSEVIGNSLRSDLAERKLHNNAKKLSAGVDLTDEQQDILVHSLRLSQYFLNEDTKGKWESFALSSAQNPEMAKTLGNIIGNVTMMGIVPEWVNSSLANAMQAGTPEEILTILDTELQEVSKKLTNLNEANSRILNIKSASGEWQDPTKFQKLQKEFAINVAYVRDNIQFSTKDPTILQMVKAKQMNEFVDGMDLTLKSLGTSVMYQDKNQQAENFRESLGEFNKVLTSWGKDVGDNHAKSNINKHLQEIFKRDINDTSMNLSGGIDVSSVTMDLQLNQGNEAEGWSRNLRNFMSLQDAFTLIHQNLLTAVTLKSQKLNETVQLQIPKEISDKAKVMESIYQQTTLRHISIDFPQTKYSYNIPLRHHSATSDLIWNKDTEKTSLVFSIFGDGGANRWETNAVETEFNLLNNGFKFITKPKFIANSNVMSMEIDITNLDISRLKDLQQIIRKDILNPSLNSIRGTDNVEISYFLNILEKSENKFFSLYAENKDSAFKYLKKINTWLQSESFVHWNDSVKIYEPHRNKLNILIKRLGITSDFLNTMNNKHELCAFISENPEILFEDKYYKIINNHETFVNMSEEEKHIFLGQLWQTALESSRDKIGDNSLIQNFLRVKKLDVNSPYDLSASLIYNIARASEKNALLEQSNDVMNSLETSKKQINLINNPALISDLNIILNNKNFYHNTLRFIDKCFTLESREKFTKEASNFMASDKVAPKEVDQLIASYNKHNFDILTKCGSSRSDLQKIYNDHNNSQNQQQTKFTFLNNKDVIANIENSGIDANNFMQLYDECKTYDSAYCVGSNLKETRHIEFYKKLYENKENGVIIAYAKIHKIVNITPEELCALGKNNSTLFYKLYRKPNQTIINEAREKGLLAFKDMDLVTAVKEGYPETVRWLIDKGSDVNACDKHDNLPICLAAGEGNKEIVQLLLKAGADINSTDVTITPLIEAISGEHKDIVNLLIEAGADVNLSAGCNTPLSEATANAFTDIVELLIDAGADVVKDSKFLLEMAIEDGSTRIVQLLEEAMAKTLPPHQENKGAELRDTSSKAKKKPVSSLSSSAPTSTKFQDKVKYRVTKNEKTGPSM